MRLLTNESHLTVADTGVALSVPNRTLAKPFNFLGR